ncbi:MAG: hypothetical protein ACK5WX_07225, partial [bacterium]
MNKSNASGIALWSRVLVGCVAGAIALTAVRVAQLKAAPADQLLRSMERPNGQLIQQRAAEEPEPRGRIVDRVGRLLALDTVGGRLFIDVKDLYTDALERAERAERRNRSRTGDGDVQAVSLGSPASPMLDPIGDLAVELSRPLGVPAGEIVAKIHEKVPAELRVLARDMTPEDWKRLPR